MAENSEDIEKASESPLCRLCGKNCERVQHIKCGCEELAHIKDDMTILFISFYFISFALNIETLTINEMNNR